MLWRPTRVAARHGLAPLALVASFCAVVAPAAAAAAVVSGAPAARALLIGVGDYPALPERLRLAAPAGDVRRLRAALVGAGLDPAAITVMTEREGERPTRAAILVALSNLAEQARPGQQLLVYFSGHGAQAPARHPAQEPDGLEELYLAADASDWNAHARTVPGSVADFEMEAALQAVEARGAQVWFVADACHAAGLTRSAAPIGARVKSASGADLHIPISATALRARSQEAAPLEAGSFAGFYAAAPGALALERLLPAGAPDAEPASVFTFALSRALVQGRFRTLRDLALAVSAGELDTGPDAPAPVFEGALASDMLGLQPVARAFRVKRIQGRLVVQAGAFEGLEAGSVMVLTDADGHAVDKARIARAGLNASELESPGRLPDGALSARLESVAAATDGGRGKRLLSVLASLAGGSGGLRTEARVLRQGCAPNPPARLGFPEQSQTFDLLAPSLLRHCDVVYVRIENTGPSALDVSPLYIDAQGEVVGLSLAPVDDVRLESGQSRFIALRLVTRDAAGGSLPHGVERLALVSALAGERRLDLRALAGPPVMRGAESPPILDREGLAAQVFALRVTD